MSTSRARLPKKRSRTSTQAISVPMTMLTSVTRNAVPTVSRMAAAVCALVTASQKCAHPPSHAVTTTAASGISTSRLNHSIATPRPRPETRVSRRPSRAARRTQRRAVRDEGWR